MSKAQGLSINTIIIAAIALIVLVLIVLIVSGNLRNWNIGANDCTTNSGLCVWDYNCQGLYRNELPRYVDSCADANLKEDSPPQGWGTPRKVCCVITGDNDA